MEIYGVVGWKNNGKTGLVERLVAGISARGIRVSTVKHAHHSVDVDQPGRDSYRHREAGAHEVALVSQKRVAIMTELRSDPEPTLEEVLARLSPVDLVLIEGYKHHPHRKIEAHRREAGSPLIAAGDATIRAVASDARAEIAAGCSVPVFDLDDTDAIARFILEETGLLGAGVDTGGHAGT